MTISDDPRDVAETAVLAIDTETLRKIVNTYNSYPTSVNALVALRVSLALAARRAIDTTKPHP